MKEIRQLINKEHHDLHHVVAAVAVAVAVAVTVVVVKLRVALVSLRSKSSFVTPRWLTGLNC